jgi:hypothetical protein
MMTWASVYLISDFPWKLKMPTPSSLLHYIWFVVRLPVLSFSAEC